MTGRDPIVRNKCRKTIGEYLYSKMKSPTAEPAPRCPPKVLIDPNSQQIYQRNKRTAFHYLFILLDDDQDGLISNTKIKIEGLDE